ncbi:SDR family NAD(P)-dependent oxidoreductase [Elioraea sp.]|uniref:SDR family NAD(P)-dependent oxidoreductase n=1 Tax=Elioraea sp. TaxID=2185103 RepID=UPI0025C3B73F|nr:SDR family NAD(P)-dependent oxidoreductase [Elioraea sp.]
MAIVTGGARGIGRAICLALARQGFAVAPVDVLEDELQQTASEIRSLGVDAMPLDSDVSDYGDVHEKARDIIRRRGRIDVLVNNAAMPQTKRILEITEADWDREMAVNLKGCFNWSHAVAPQMVAQGAGRIINISSVSANHGPSPTGVSRFAYAAAKAGVLGLTRGLAVELAPHVLVNAICPGPIETERTRATFAPNRDQLTRSILVGRIGTPEDVAVVASFLACAEPLFMTGEVIDVDGGAFIN